MASDYPNARSRTVKQKHGERPSILDWEGTGFAGQVNTGLSSMHEERGGLLQIPPTARVAALAQSVTASGSPQSVLVDDSTVFSLGSLLTIWSPSDVPADLSYSDLSAITVGMSFKSDIDGIIVGVRFYNGADHYGQRVGLLYSDSGSLLAQANFHGWTASGWQQINFATPISIVAGTTYVVAYFTSVGYAKTASSPAHDNGTLHGINGAYSYGSTPTFPSTSIGVNYWADVVFAKDIGSAFSEQCFLDFGPSYEEVTVTDIPDVTHIQAIFSKNHITGTRIFINSDSPTFPQDTTLWDLRAGVLRLQRGNSNDPVTQTDRNHPMLWLYSKNDAAVPGYDPGVLNPWGYCPVLRVDVESTSGDVTSPHGGIVVIMDGINGRSYAKTTAPITGSGSPQTISVDAIDTLRTDAAMSIAWGQKNSDAALVSIIDSTHVSGTFVGNYPTGTLIGLPFQGDKIGIGVQMSDQPGNLNDFVCANFNVTAKSNNSLIAFGLEIDVTNSTKAGPGYFGNGPWTIGLSVQAAGGSQFITLTSGIDNATSTIPISTAGSIYNGGYIQVDGETMLVNSGAGSTTLSVTRGARSSFTASHLSGALVTVFAISTHGIFMGGAEPGSSFYHGIAVGAAFESGLIIEDTGVGVPDKGIMITGCSSYGIVIGSDQDIFEANTGYPPARDPRLAAILVTKLIGEPTQTSPIRYQVYDTGTSTSTLSGDVISTDTSVNVVSGAGYSNGQYIYIEHEIIGPITVSGNNLAGSRGALHTVAANHVSGIAVNKNPVIHDCDLLMNTFTGLLLVKDGTWTGAAINLDGGIDSQTGFRLRKADNSILAGLVNTSDAAQAFIGSAGPVTDVMLYVNGTTRFDNLTGSLPLKLDSSRNLIAAKIDLGSSADISGTGLTSGDYVGWDGSKIVNKATPIVFGTGVADGDLLKADVTNSKVVTASQDDVLTWIVGHGSPLVISDIDGLQTALDAKEDASTYAGHVHATTVPDTGGHSANTSGPI